MAPDVVLKNQPILLRDGKIAGVGEEIPADAMRGVETIEHDFVIAGFVSAHDHLSTGDDLAERISSFTPDLRATDALDPFDAHARRLATAGVTTVGLAPLSFSTFPGLIGTVSLDGGDADAILETTADSAVLKLALVAEALDPERYPTSAMGAARLIRESFVAAQNPDASGADPAYASLREVLSGRPVMIHARTHGEITRALDLCEQLEVQPLLLGADEAERSIDRLAKLRGSVVLAPLTMQSRIPQLQLPHKLEQAGISFSFAGNTVPSRLNPGRGSLPHGLPPGFPIELLMRGGSRNQLHAPTPTDPRTLRRSIALAVRNGVTRQGAHAAMTTTPALQLGADDRGSLRLGRRADLVAFDGDPVDLTSRIQAVYIAGQRMTPVNEN